MKFTKMQGLGNDYVYVDCTDRLLKDPAALAVRVSDRHFGVGSDGLICIAASDCADFRMDMYNSDGSQAEMCGNGIRCVGKFVYDKGLTRKTQITVETLAGIKTLQLHVKDSCVDTVTVDMGKPELRPEKIPVAAEGETFLAQPLRAAGQDWTVTCVSMGNPHCITYVDDLYALDIETIGPAFEHHPLFPARINTEFVRVMDRKTLQMRVWERGSGETMACGTGACATLAATVLNGLCEREAVVRLSGGDLQIRWDEQDGHIYMTGPAVISFDGELYGEEESLWCD